MSHISTYKVKVKDVATLLVVAKAQGHNVKMGDQIVQQFGSNRVEAIASVHLKDWRYPVAVTNQGELKYDHFGSKPNTMPYLGSLVQRYNEEVIMNNVNYADVTNSYKEKMKNGDVKLVFEYDMAVNQ